MAIKRCTWNEWRDSGLHWWTNRILHTFGWSIIIEFNQDGSSPDVYPARTTCLGFSPEVDDNRLTQFKYHIMQGSTHD